MKRFISLVTFFLCLFVLFHYSHTIVPSIQVEVKRTVPWMDFPPAQPRQGTDFLSDITSHMHEPRQNYGQTSTNAHEWLHGINSYLRNHYASGRHANAFYVGNNHAIILDEPNFQLQDVSRYIPADLRGFRFQLYLKQQQRDWNKEPLYLLDEFTAYIAGETVGMEIGQADVTSMIEFSIYVTALAMATKELDARYWEQNESFRLFVTWCIERAHFIYEQCNGHEGLHDKLKSSSQAETMRVFMRTHLTDAWLR